MGKAWLRAAALALGTALLAFALLCVYAAPRIAGWRSQPVTPLPATAFQGGAAEGDALRIERAAGAAPHLLALAPDAPLRGRFLSYRFDPLPGDLRLLLGWRTSATADWTWTPVPQAGGTTTLDLVRLSQAWTGEAAALAFLLLPAELLPADAVPAHRLRFHGAMLEGDGRAAAVAAVLDEWRAYSPWTGRSINTGGFGAGMDAPRPVQGFVLACVLAVMALLALWCGLRRRRRAIAPGLLAVLVAGWLLLDLVQLRALAQRSLHLSRLDAAADGALSVHPGLAASLAVVRTHPALAGKPRRIAVLAPDGFRRTWPVYALLPLDAAALAPGDLPRIRPGTLVLRLGAGEYVPGSGVLRADGAAVPVRELHADAQAQLLETLAPAEPRP